MMKQVILIRPYLQRACFLLFNIGKKITIYGSFKCLIVCIFLSKAKKTILPIKTEFCAEFQIPSLKTRPKKQSSLKLTFTKNYQLTQLPWKSRPGYLPLHFHCVYLTVVVPEILMYKKRFRAPVSDFAK